MIGCIKAISLCVKGASQTQSCSWTCTPCVGAECGEERTLDAAAQVERAIDGVLPPL